MLGAVLWNARIYPLEQMTSKKLDMEVVLHVFTVHVNEFGLKNNLKFD